MAEDTAFANPSFNKVNPPKYSFDLPRQYNIRPSCIKKFNPRNPSIIFTNGPTGSGKSGLLVKTIELMYYTKNIEPLNFQSFLIDDYVENSDAYKSKVKDIITNFDCNNPSSTTCNLENPSPELLQAFSKAYFKVRRDGPCYPEPKEQKGCKDFLDDDLTKAITSKQNIIIETTGKKIPSEYLDKLISITNLADYNIIFVYSLVSFEDLKIRNKSRARNGIKSFIGSEYANPAPRLPDISDVAFKNVTNNIERTLITLRNICMRCGNPNKETCGEINSGRNFILLIYDNNEQRSKLIYDSRTSDQFLSDQEFISILSRYNLSGGKLKFKNSKKRKSNTKKRLKRKTRKIKRLNKKIK